MRLPPKIRSVIVERGKCHRLQLFETCQTTIPAEAAAERFRYYHPRSYQNVPLAQQIFKGRFLIFDKTLWVMARDKQIEIVNDVVMLTDRGAAVRGKAPIKVCPHGHALTPENIRVKRDGEVFHRVCRLCSALSDSKGRNSRNIKEGKPSRTHCKHQHALTPDNVTLKLQGGKFVAVCRQCKINANLRYYQKALKSL